MIRFSIVLVTISLQAQSPQAYVAAARQAEAGRDLAEAERDYEKALALRPDPIIYQRLGLVRHLESKFAPAISAFRAALKLDPEQWASHLFLGIDLYRTNEFRAALPELERADRLRPNDFETRFWIGVTHLALKEYLPGLEILETLSKEQPGNLEILRILAENYAAFGTSLLNHVAESWPDSPAGLQVHAQALEFEGANEAALEVYRKLERIEPDRAGVKEALDRLKSRPRGSSDSEALPQ